MTERFRLLGDHAKEHCGCAAVTDALIATLSDIGRIVGPKDDYDTLVMNGEGSMHHGRKAFQLKMHQLRLAQDRGKKTWLVNTVWQDNPNDFDDVLSRLDRLAVRGVASARDLRDRHGITPSSWIDLSYFAEIDETAPFIDLKGAIAVTDIHNPGFGFAWMSAGAADGWKRVDMRALSWSGLVRTLRTAKVVIAGRHHAIYAACKARTPFVPARGNSHKIDDLLESAGVEIPTAREIQEIGPLLKWVDGARPIYRRLFDWMAVQPRWSPDAIDPAPGLPEARTVLQRANEAFYRRAYAEAAPLWSDIVARRGADTPDPRNACQSLFGGGAVETAIPFTALCRTRKSDSIAFTRILMSFARSSPIWDRREPGGDWWPLLREAAYQASVDAVPASRRLAEAGLAALLSAHGPVAARTAALFLACKLVQLNLHGEALDLHDRSAFETGGDEWMHQQDRLLLDSLCRRFDNAALTRLRQADGLPAWSDPSFRTTVFHTRCMIEGPSAGLLDSVIASLDDYPRHAGLRDLLFSMAGEAGRFDLIEVRPFLDKATVRAAAIRMLPISRHLVNKGAVGNELVRRAALLEAFEAGRDQMVALFSDPSIRIAVVGNSPIEIGRGRGADIDACDVVVRFNEFSTAPDFVADYGARTDVICQTYPINLDMLDGREAASAIWLQRHAFNLFEPRDWSDVLAMHAAGGRFAYLDRDAYASAALALGATPSAGFVLASVIKRLRGHIAREDFFGFSFVDQLEGARRAHYFNDEPPAHIHDWRLEVEAFERLFTD